MIHRVKGFSIVNETEVDVFLEFSCFLYDSENVSILILVLMPFLNPAWTSACFQFMCWRLVWRIFSIILLEWEMTAIVHWFEHWMPFLGIVMRIDLFQSCGHRWVFQICWYIASTLIASSFRILDRSAGISSPPLAYWQHCFLRPTWPHTPECLALSERLHHLGYQVIKIFFVQFFWVGFPSLLDLFCFY